MALNVWVVADLLHGASSGCGTKTADRYRVLFRNIGRLFCRGKAHTVRTPVEDGVVLHDEDVSQDPQGCFRRAPIHTHEARHAD